MIVGVDHPSAPVPRSNICGSNGVRSGTPSRDWVERRSSPTEPGNTSVPDAHVAYAFRIGGHEVHSGSGRVVCQAAKDKLLRRVDPRPLQNDCPTSHRPKFKTSDNSATYLKIRRAVAKQRMCDLYDNTSVCHGQGGRAGRHS